MTLISGRNGQGKSSIIEALGFTLTGRSFRSAPKDAIIRKNEPGAVVRCEIIANERELLVEHAINRARPDTLLLNRNEIQRREMTRIAPVTIFTTRDLEIISGSPESRRTFIDNALIYMGPRAANCVDNYEKLLRHRASLLRKIAFNNSSEDLDTLSVFDQALANEGEVLVSMRRTLLTKLFPIVNTLYAGIAGNNESITIEYATKTSTDLYSELLRARFDDLKRGVTSVGPHRDDVIFSLNGLNARHESSQGEQRSLAFSLIMGLHELIRDRLGDDPIVLLDDIFSELDQERVDKVLQVAEKAQVIVTTSADYSRNTKVGQRLRIESGQLV